MAATCSRRNGRRTCPPSSPRVRLGVPQGGDTLYTLVNRVARNTSGAQLAVPLADFARYRAGALRFFDVYHGVELAPTLSTAAAAASTSSSGGGATATSV